MEKKHLIMEERLFRLQYCYVQQHSRMPIKQSFVDKNPI